MTQNPKTPHDRMYELLGILQSYAPKGSDQAYCATMVNQMAADGVSLQMQAANLASAISDGLRYGNWPWAIRDLSLEDRAKRALENLKADIPPTEVTAVWMDPDEINKD